MSGVPSFVVQATLERVKTRPTSGVSYRASTLESGDCRNSTASLRSEEAGVLESGDCRNSAASLRNR